MLDVQSFLGDETATNTPEQITASVESEVPEPDSRAILFIKEECRKLVRGQVTRERREELDEWVQHPDIYPYYVQASTEFAEELRALGYDVGGLCSAESSSS